MIPSRWPCTWGLVCMLTGAGLYAAPGDGVWRLDFGAPDSAVLDGFQRVAPDTAYSAERGLGYVQTGRRPPRLTPFDQNRHLTRDALTLDDATRDGIYGAATFRLDLPNAAYRVAVLTGQFSRPGANRPDSHFRAYTIKGNGVTLYEQNDTAEAFFHPRSRYFHSYYRD